MFKPAFFTLSIYFHNEIWLLGSEVIEDVKILLVKIDVTVKLNPEILEVTHLTKEIIFVTIIIKKAHTANNCT